MTSQPLAGYLPHGFGCSVLYPAHEITVELEIGPACLGHKPSYVLRVSIAGVYRCFVRYLIAVPVEMGHRFAFVVIGWYASRRVPRTDDRTEAIKPDAS